MPERPVLFILDPSTDATGALIAAAREASVLRGLAAVTLVLPKSSRIPEELLFPFDRVVRLPIIQIRKSAPSLLLYFPALFVAGWRLARLLRASGCERLQLNDFYLMQGAAARLFGYRGRIVTWVRVDPARFGAFGRIWLHATRRASDEIVAVSKFIRERLAPVITARLVYDPAPVVPPRLPGQRLPRFVFVGNYIKGKGQDLAIAAFERVAASVAEAELHFYGGDMGLPKNRDFREALERRAAAGPAAGRIHFHGFCAELSPAYHDALAALNFSDSESFSLTCQEASARALPVVATRCGGPEEIVEDGRTGFLVDAGDVDAMAERMLELASDHRRAAAMGQRGRELVCERFSERRFRDQLKSLFSL